MFKTNFFILDSLSKIQKSSLVSFVKIFVKKNHSLSAEDIYFKFLDEMEYDFAINNPKFPWIEEFLESEKFEKDVKNIIKNTLQQMVYKEAQKPYIEKQKAYAKIARKKATEWRQSHEKPTRKQISYYNALCEKNKVAKVDLSEKSKLDLKNMISELLNEKKVSDEL